MATGGFVGRHAESALVALTLDQSTAGAPSALIVRGEPGIGKTRLLAEAVSRARGRGQHVIWVCSNALESRVPYGALTVALDRAAASDPAIEPAATAMRALIEGPESESRQSFARHCDTFTRILTELGELAPTSVVVDDLHVLDHESLALLGVTLGRMGGRVSGGSVAFVCSTRSSARDLNSQAAELLARLAEWPDVEDMELGPMAREHVRVMLEDVYAKPVSEAVAEVVATRSGGNPLFVLEMARSLSELDILDLSADDIGFHHDPADLHLTRHTTILQRLFPLTADCRSVAQIVAVLHRIRLTDLDLVADLAGLELDDIGRAFDELERRGIIVRDGDQTWSLFHQFVADALYDDIGPAERRRIHRRIAERVLQARRQGAPVDVLRLAWHVSESADVGDLEAARTLGEAAESIRTTGPISAAETCARAIALLPDASTLRGELLALRTRCLILAGRPGDAVEAGLAALDELPAGDERTKTATAVIGALFDVGRSGEALALAEREVDTGPPSAFLLSQHAMLSAVQGRAGAARHSIAAALDIPRRSAGEEVLVRSFLSSAATLAGPIAEGLAHLDLLAEAAGKAGTNMNAYALTRRCFSLVTSGFVREAAAATAAAEAALGDIGPGTYHAGVSASRIGLDWMRGEWDHAADALADSKRDLDVINNAIIQGYLRTVEIEIRAARGQLREALALVNLPVPGIPVTQRAWAGAGVLRSTGDVDGARSMLREALERPVECCWVPHVMLRLLEIELDAGREADAKRALVELERLADLALDPRPWVQAMQRRGAALVHHDRVAALDSIAIAASEGMAYETALGRLALGAFDPSAIDDVLAAHEVLGTLGAEVERRRAAALLRRAGAKVPRRRKRPPGQLTEAEAQIARLVQAGLRNREIARSTNYSERTVEVYLSRIFAKLGVRSRLQLARLLDEDVAGELTLD